MSKMLSGIIIKSIMALHNFLFYVSLKKFYLFTILPYPSYDIHLRLLVKYFTPRFHFTLTIICTVDEIFPNRLFSLFLKISTKFTHHFYSSFLKMSILIGSVHGIISLILLNHFSVTFKHSLTYGRTNIA